MKVFGKKTSPHYEELLYEIQKTKDAMDIAYSNFEYVVDPELIDSYIYELNAVQERYKFLLRQIKLLTNDVRNKVATPQSTGL